jgi:histone H3/H4
MPSFPRIDRKRTRFIPGVASRQRAAVLKTGDPDARVYRSTIRKAGRRAGILRIKGDLFDAMQAQIHEFVHRVLDRANTMREFEGRAIFMSRHVRRALAAEKTPIYLV